MRCRFQSTPSVGRATIANAVEMAILAISIHALRGEGDLRASSCILRVSSFQSTPSVGRATINPQLSILSMIISIHALRGEGDTHNSLKNSFYIHFNPRPPWGGRQQMQEHMKKPTHFNPRPPWGGRPITVIITLASRQFQSTPSVGRAT